MDSVTQLVLGAAIGTVVASRHLGVRKAALIGGVLGTLPDLDTFYPFANPIDSFVLHRSATHSLIVQTVLAPLFGLMLARQFRFSTQTAILMVWLVWVTHALLDGITVYGTQLLWPLSYEPYGIGSLFIIDPLYSLPLLISFICCLFYREWSIGIERGVVAALVISTAYIGWSLVAQNMAGERAKAWLVEHGIESDATLTTPLPFNTLFWRTIAVSGDHFYNIYVPLLADGDAVLAHRHRRVDSAGACALALPEGQRLEAFSHGFVQALSLQDSAVVSDLRMGVTPNYVFNFAIATNEGSALGEPIQISPPSRVEESDWAWLRAGIFGEPKIRMAERDELVQADAEFTKQDTLC